MSQDSTTSPCNRPLRIVVRDDEADAFSTPTNKKPTQAASSKKPVKKGASNQHGTCGDHGPFLDNLYTSYIAPSFHPNPPDPGNHRLCYHLDWSSPASLRRNQHKLTRAQRWYLQHLEERVKAFSKSFDRADGAEDDYRAVACMIAMACSRSSAHDRDASADLSFKDRFLRCRRIKYKTAQGNVRYGGKCGQRRFCPFCNYVKRQEALLTYVPAFDRGRWYSMTVSSTPELDLDFDELTYSWDAVKAVVEALIQAGHFQGAYWTEEVSLNSLYPDVLVLPHGHVLFHALSDVDEAAVRALAEQVFWAHFNNLEQVPVAAGQADSVAPQAPSVRLAELRTRADLYRWCDYLTKTMRIVDAYRNALEVVEDEDRWFINAQFEQFLHGMVLMLEEDTPPRRALRAEADDAEPKRPWVPWRKQRHSLGTLRPGRSGRFVGVRPTDRHKHCLDLEALRREIVAEQAALNKDGDAGGGASE